LLSKHPRVSEIVAFVGAALAGLFALLSLASFLQSPAAFVDFYGFLYMDSVSALFTTLTAIIAPFVFLYSIGYLRHETKEGVIEEKQLGGYYCLLSLFLAVMLMATLASNIITMWAFIEATTLASVFLISFYSNAKSIEAAWKFFIINSTGILLALVGIIILLSAVLPPGSETGSGWINLLSAHGAGNMVLLKVAFAFIFIGFGTKFGLAPLHVWLPDAHSQAPTPVSALLSGVLLNIAFYGILRGYMVISPYPEVVAFASNLLIFFGLLSLAVGALRLYSQNNIKRMLAYSSVENMGIIALGLGIGGPIGVLAALFHMISHSFAKPLAFFASGILAFAFNTKEINLISGAAQVVPAFAILFVFISVGVAGSPPFGTFLSELGILAASLSASQFIAAALFIILTTVTFATLLYRASGMAFGAKSKSAIVFTPDWTKALPFVVLLILAIYFGMTPPHELIQLLEMAARAIRGV